MRATILTSVAWLLKLVVIGLIILWSAIAHLRATSSEKLLSRIQTIRQGDTREEVKQLMGDQPVTFGASALPDWMKKVVMEKPQGEYWYYGLGPYPPRILIIYFGADEKVDYVTWTDS